MQTEYKPMQPSDVFRERVVGRTRAMLSLFTRWSEERIREAAEEAASRSKIDPETKSKGAANKIEMFFPDEDVGNATIDHELIHHLSLGRDDLATAQAWSSYAQTPQYQTSETGFTQNHKEISKAFSRSALKIGGEYDDWEKTPPRSVRFLRRLGKKMLDRRSIGWYVGFAATHLERVEKRPKGVGAYFIMQVTTGTPAHKAWEKAKNGEYDEKALDWMNKHGL